MNKSLVYDTSRMKAIKIQGLIPDEATRKIVKETDLSVLKDLWLIYYQGDKTEMMKITEKRIVELGGSVR
jgi:hypothetical protein